MKTLTVLVLVLTAMGGHRAMACSCNNLSLEDALARASDVIVARVIGTHQAPAEEDASGRYIVETASFVVVESIKGSKEVGDVVQTRSEIGPGTCGISARNNPAWLEQAPERAGMVSEVKISDTWLIFREGTQPFELTFCSKSMPLNVGGSDEVAALHRLLRSEKHESQQAN
jgi:hypothetical protein